MTDALCHLVVDGNEVLELKLGRLIVPTTPSSRLPIEELLQPGNLGTNQISAQLKNWIHKILCYTNIYGPIH